MYFLFWLALGFVAVHLMFFADAQRAIFGDIAGNMLIAAEVVTIVSIGIVGWLWLRKQEKSALVVGFASAAVLFAFAGWFVLPEHRYERALNRVLNSEHALNEYAFEQQYLPDPPNERSLHMQRIKEELAARKLELRAAEVRFNGDPRFFRSYFKSWMLWIDSLICVVGAIFILRLPNNAPETDVH